MGTKGYFAYRYKAKYYRQYLSCDAYPYGHGQRIVDLVPRNPCAFKDWVIEKTKMLENAKTADEEVVYPLEDCINADELGFEVIYDIEWMFVGGDIEWTYVIDLDHLAFTLNGTTHLKLDNMPPKNPSLEDYFENEVRIPEVYLIARLNLWPTPKFNIEECQQKYEAMDPTVLPITEWGAPTWDELSISQRGSIKITHYLLRKTSHAVANAYLPTVQEKIGRFCWDFLCASVPAFPIFPGEDDARLLLPDNVISCGFTLSSNFRPYKMCYETGKKSFKNLRKDYCWIRGCLVTFCVQLGNPAYVAHEVEQMVQKMRLDGSTESVGIILSSQQELVAVALDGPRVRHTPVLDLSTTHDGERPGDAS
ncbi:unnamed protein product, partial [Rhizoctonia solani]